MQITDYLEEKRVNYQICAHRPAFTSQQMAAEEHVPGMNVAKPVIVQADGKYYMCVLPACCKVDLDTLRRQLGAGEVELASEKEMAQLFPDCELGAEPPFGNMYGISTIMDKTLSRDEYLLFQAGKHDQAVRISLNDYETLVHPRVLDFSYHLH
jgi:Ala-tRNA(Pro) deacylase